MDKVGWQYRKYLLGHTAGSQLGFSHIVRQPARNHSGYLGSVKKWSKMQNHMGIEGGCDTRVVDPTGGSCFKKIMEHSKILVR